MTSSVILYGLLVEVKQHIRVSTVLWRIKNKVWLHDQGKNMADSCHTAVEVKYGSTIKAKTELTAAIQP